MDHCGRSSRASPMGLTCATAGLASAEPAAPSIWARPIRRTACGLRARATFMSVTPIAAIGFAFIFVEIEAATHIGKATATQLYAGSPVASFADQNFPLPTFSQ